MEILITLLQSLIILSLSRFTDEIDSLVHLLIILEIDSDVVCKNDHVVFLEFSIFVGCLQFY